MMRGTVYFGSLSNTTNRSAAPPTVKTINNQRFVRLTTNATKVARNIRPVITPARSHVAEEREGRDSNPISLVVGDQGPDRPFEMGGAEAEKVVLRRQIPLPSDRLKLGD